MAEFTVFPAKMEQRPQNIRNMAGTMNRYISSIGNIERNLAVSGQAKSAIRSSLSGLRRNLDQRSRSMNSMAECLSAAAQLYKSTEKSITSEKTNQQKISSPQGNAAKSASVFGGSAAVAGTVLGIKSAGETKGDAFGASWDAKFESGAKWKNGKLDSVSLFKASASGEAYVAQGGAKGNIGLASVEGKGSVGKVSAKGEVGAALYKDGKLAPQIGARAEVSAVGAEGEANAAFGSKNNNVHAKVNGKAGVANAYAEASAGRMTYKTESGELKTTDGVKLEAGAEAYAWEVKASAGVDVFGIKIDVGTSGKAVGAGVEIGYTQTTGGMKGKLGLGVGLGAEVEVSIDWSDFKLGW